MDFAEKVVDGELVMEQKFIFGLIVGCLTRMGSRYGLHLSSFLKMLKLMLLLIKILIVRIVI